jgi:hypothetical protein
MKKRITKGSEASRAVYSELEGYARRKVQEFIQALLEEEVTEFLGRPKSERRAQAGWGERISQWLWQAASASDEQRHDQAETAAGAGLRGEIREPGVTAVQAAERRSGTVVAGAVFAWAGERRL